MHQYRGRLIFVNKMARRFLVRDVIYTSVCPSVCHLSLTEVQWRIIANLGFKFRS